MALRAVRGFFCHTCKMKDVFGRKILPHQAPPWVDPAAGDYFVTICCQQRETNQLCTPHVGNKLLDSARFYYDRQKWFPSLFLLMPDHLHTLVSFGREQEMTGVIAAWKRYTAKQYGIEWQRGFFEHRLRAEESVAEKGTYILQNPVRAGLVEDATTRHYVLMLP